MARLIFKPITLVSAVMAGKVAGKLLERIWPALDRKGDGTVPPATAPNVSLRRAAAGNMVQAATFAGTKAVFERATVRGIYHYTGLWAGAKPVKPAAADEPVSPV